MRTILFPTDFTPASENAELFAVEIAKKIDAKLYLLHVEDESTSYETSSYEADYDVVVGETPLKRLKTIIENNLLEKHPNECLVKEGQIPKTIIEVAKDLDVELLVIGSKGTQNYRSSDSNVLEIIRSVECAVLTVPKESKYKSIGNIVYATDLIHKDDQSFFQLVKFAKAFDADVTLLHVNVDGKDMPGKAPLKSIPEIMEAIDYEKIESKVIIAPSIVEGIHKYNRDNKVDVLAMTSHSDTFLDKFFRNRTIDKIVLWTDLPILTFSS